MNLNMIDNFDFLLSKKIRINNKIKNIFDRTFYPSDTHALVGCYNTSNIGDLALRDGATKLISNKGTLLKSCNYADIPSIESKAKSLILGGGGVLTAHPTSPINKIKAFNNHDGNNKKIAIWGCSGNIDKNEIDEELQQLLMNAAYLSVRSEDALQSLKEITQRKDIDLIPDLAFALDTKKQKSHSIKKVVGINLFPPLINVVGKSLIQNQEPSDWYKKHMPELAARYLKIPIDYIDATKAIITNLKKQGYKVVNVAFTLEDYLVAKNIYKGFVDEFLPFKQDPMFLIEQIVDFDFFIATRFHAHIFSLIANTPLYSLAYAPKCEMLYDDFTLDKTQQFSTVKWVGNKDELIESFSKPGGVTMSRQDLDIIRCKLERSAERLLNLI